MTNHPLPDADDPLRAAAQVMHAVRDQCVWTQRMTHRDLVPYLVEESAELSDAVEAGTPADVREELGDVLWQVLFHAEIASRDQAEAFDIDDVARDLAAKMIRRHPHVFGDAVATTPEQVRALWSAAKAAEKRDRRSVLDGVSDRMPALALAQKLLGRAASVPDPDAAAQVPDLPSAGGIAAAAEKQRDARSVGRNTGSHGRHSFPERPETEAELGDALLALVGVARAHGWDAERALRERLRRLRADVRAAEHAAAEDAAPEDTTRADTAAHGTALRETAVWPAPAATAALAPGEDIRRVEGRSGGNGPRFV